VKNRKRYLRTTLNYMGDVVKAFDATRGIADDGQRLTMLSMTASVALALMLEANGHMEPRWHSGPQCGMQSPRSMSAFRRKAVQHEHHPPRPDDRPQDRSSGRSCRQASRTLAGLDCLHDTPLVFTKRDMAEIRSWLIHMAREESVLLRLAFDPTAMSDEEVAQ
jgi:hypothetical protein